MDGVSLKILALIPVWISARILSEISAGVPPEILPGYLLGFLGDFYKNHFRYFPKNFTSLPRVILPAGTPTGIFPEILPRTHPRISPKIPQGVSRQFILEFLNTFFLVIPLSIASGIFLANYSGIPSEILEWALSIHSPEIHARISQAIFAGIVQVIAPDIPTERFQEFLRRSHKSFIRNSNSDFFGNFNS